MPQKTIKGSSEIAQQIRRRRNELGLTIEEAASRANVGIKTWCRYEAGESIRREKCKGICKALNWRSFPGQGDQDRKDSPDEYRDHGAWSDYLEDSFGADAALSFAAGSDILLDHIEEDTGALSSMPKGSHLGQLDISLLRDILPGQFLMEYDYDFLYRLKCALKEMTDRAYAGEPMTAYSVLQELILYLCSRESAVILELGACPDPSEDQKEDGKEGWVFDLLGDADLITFLYSGQYLKQDHSYHFSHWDDLRFDLSEDEPKSSLASLFE
ncbi:MAG: helix-turn-helix domain-containing protein [Clostridia bacterium]|nr:helix-turn-helix domain-containing protein [Clostridia bacterium]MBR0444908.1 helix-turn-helix domain-containing protein [Clostridia bacterium]